jgi:hypothetical protein
MFSIFCGNAVGGVSADIAITNSTSATNWGVRHVGWFRSRGSDMGASFSYISPVGVQGFQPFAVGTNVTQFDVILNGWTQDSVPTIGL